MEQTVGGGDVDCSSSEQIYGCIKQTRVCLEEIKHPQETQTNKTFNLFFPLL